ncbi:MAG: hypothetical protein UZ09_BCD002001647 [Bacteroidetes bacterium OLB9]|nr:MAG: hypothetical protein UZ09_BCD002001647 [Bacteroidetes bacterium OLB9]
MYKCRIFTAFNMVECKNTKPNKINQSLTLQLSQYKS